MNNAVCEGIVVRISGIFFLLTVSVWAAEYSWTPTAAGTAYNWNNAGAQNNWGSGFPGGAGDVAFLTNNIVGTQTVSLNQVITNGILRIGDTNGSHAFTLTPNGGAFVVDNGASEAVIAGQGTGTINDSILASMLLNSPLSLSGSPTLTHTLTLGGVLSAKDGDQAITVSGGSVVVTNQNTAYANGWTVLTNATLNLAGRSYRSGARYANYALGLVAEANSVVVKNGGTLISAVNDGAIHLSGPVTLENGAALRQISTGGGRVGNFADGTVADGGTVFFSYLGTQIESKLRFGTLTLAGDATLDIRIAGGGASAGGGLIIDPATVEALALQDGGTVGSVHPDFTTAEGLVLGAGKTLIKTGNGTLLLNVANTALAGALDVQEGCLSLGHQDALNAAAGNRVRSGAVLALRAAGFGTTSGRLKGAEMTQDSGSIERWYFGGARFLNNSSDSYSPPAGVDLQVGLSGTTATPDWNDTNVSGSHVLRLNGTRLGVWAEQENAGWFGSSRAAFLGFSWTSVNKVIPASSARYTLFLDGNSYLGSADTTSYLPEYRQLFINFPIKDGTAGTGITKVGPETVILSGANTYSGATVVDAGTLAIGRDDALPVTTVLSVSRNAFFDLFNGGDNTVRNKQWTGPLLNGGPGSGNGLLGASWNQTVAGLTGEGVVANGLTNLATLTVGNGLSNTFAGVLTGPLALAKTGSGTLILSGTNYHTGGTAVTAGTLVANGAAYVAAGTVTGNFGNSSRRSFTVADAGELARLAVGQPIAAACVPEGTYLAGANGTTLYMSRYSGNVSSNQLAVAVAYGGGAALGTGPVAVSGSGTLTLNGTLANANVTVSGGKLNGTGTVRLTVSGAACETVTVSGGELDLSGLTLALQTGAGGATERQYTLVDYAAGGTLTLAPGGVFAAVTGLPAGYAVYDKPSVKRIVLGLPVSGTILSVQ